MMPASAHAITWYVQHRPRGDTLAEASVLTVDALTPGEAIDRARASLRTGHVLTPVARYEDFNGP
jgi:hypothetical protein